MEARPAERKVSPAWKRSLRQRLLAWFSEHARDLPWRKTRDLYAIWISEIMLQQTQVATVIPYYERFLERFPTVESLAAADEHELLRYWEGLGYYRRARQLHAAAQQIVREHGGNFPESFEAVHALPGVGRYTAGAILSIGRDARLPILEANTVRVASRLLGYTGDVYSAAGQKDLWQFAEAILPARQVGTFNQALMELGATLCTPRTPACLLCPVASLCPARQRGLQERIPGPKRKMQYEDVAEAAVVVRRRDGKILVRQCQPGERWAGLWDFPRVATGAGQPPLLEAIEQLVGLRVRLGEQFATLKHGVTRFRITLACYHAQPTSEPAARRGSSAGMKWIEAPELKKLALSVTGRRISHMLNSEEA